MRRKYTEVFITSDTGHVFYTNLLLKNLFVLIFKTCLPPLFRVCSVSYLFTVRLWKHCSFHTILYCCEHLLVVYWAFRSIWISTKQVWIEPVWYWRVMSEPLFRPVLLDTILFQDSDQTMGLSFILTFSLFELCFFKKNKKMFK